MRLFNTDDFKKATSTRERIALGIVRGEMRYSPTELQSYSTRRREDIAIYNLLKHFGVSEMSYLDIGANHPWKGSNTYLFYLLGNRGVLVEPLREYCDQLRRIRFADTVVEAAVSPDDKEGVATFNLRPRKTGSFLDGARTDVLDTVVEKRKVKCIGINTLLNSFASGKGPAFIDVDAEGYDLAILKSMDFKKYTGVRVISTEVSAGCDAEEFLKSKGFARAVKNRRNVIMAK
jgi:FkbM family methyltransferase